MKILITGGAGFLGQRLAQQLLQRSDLEQLILADIVAPANPTQDARVQTLQADLTDPNVSQALITNDLTAIYHLAAVVSSQAEADFDLGMRVNCDGTRHLLEATRHNAPGALFVFASSLAVFGGDLPTVITDQTAVTPQSSYGTEKAIGELLVNDYSRKGFIDGRVLRLPTVCVRPGKPNAAASSFASSIIREPVQGDRAICPVDLTLELWLSSPETVTENLAHALTLKADQFKFTRTLNLPGITVSVQSMLDALAAVAGEDARAKVDCQYDESISRIVASWPSQFDVSTAMDLGFKRDRTFQDIVKAFMTQSS